MRITPMIYNSCGCFVIVLFVLSDHPQVTQFSNTANMSPGDHPQVTQFSNSANKSPNDHLQVTQLSNTANMSPGDLP